MIVAARAASHDHRLVGAVVGAVDAMRIGPDVAITWEPIFKGNLTDPATATQRCLSAR